MKMAYKINGKVYTENPLMDEIVYNTKLILDGIVVKNEMLANSFEEMQYMEEIEARYMIINNTMNFEVFPFTIEILTAFGYDQYLARAIITNRNNAPEADRANLVAFGSKYLMNNYEEKNKYYRMLIGLPEYGTNEYDVYIDSSYIPKNYKKQIDFSKPLHKMDLETISILKTSGKMNEIINSHRGFSYAYLRFLGDNKIDLDMARKAGKFDILYIPAVESLVSDRFKELYNLNKEIYLKRTYSDAYAFDSDYYEEVMIFMILGQTFNDMVVDVPEWYIRRDIFDLRSVQYFLDSYGVEFFPEIPLKYQIRIVKNLNKLIKYKSSDKNFEDILDIFSLKNTSIYNYYLFKKRKKDSFGNFVTGSTDEEKYDLEFIRAKIGESYDDYIKDAIYHSNYDDLTLLDKYWDGEDPHEKVQNEHLEMDFTIENTKYMSIEYNVSLDDYLFQLEYFMGMLFDSNIDTDDIRINIPSIDSSVSFKLSNLFFLLYLLTLSYDGCPTNITHQQLRNDTVDGEKPEFKKYDDYNGGYSHTKEWEYDPVYSVDSGKNGIGYLTADGGKLPYSEITSVEEFYDWMKKSFPELFIVDEKVRTAGFNTRVDKEKVSEIIGRRHSKFQFEHGFDLSYFGLDSFIVPKDIDSIDDLVEIYNTNKECYYKLKSMMTDKRPERDTYKIMQYLYKQFFTKDYDDDFYLINGGTEKATKLEQVLQDKDYILYNLYSKIISETNLEVRRDTIRNVMNDIVNTLEYYLNYEGLEFVLSFTTVNSFDSIVKYIYLMINFFKSYKVYFLDPHVTYTSESDSNADSKLQNNAYAHDTISEKEIQYLKWDKQFARDVTDIRSTRNFSSNERARIIEVLDIYGHFDPDPEDDYDYDGKYADTDEEYKDADGGTADDASCVPYIMLNGGNSSLGMVNMWDLDGATASEMQEYLDVNAGYAFDGEPYRNDYWKYAFQYIIDGGSAGTNQFITKSLHTRVIDDQISSEARISSITANALVQKEDGLYLEQLWTSWEEFNELEKSSDALYSNFSNSYNTLSEIINIALDEDIQRERIQQAIDDKLSTARRVIQFYENNTVEQEAIILVDNQIRALYEEFANFSPLEWTTFAKELLENNTINTTTEV